MKAVLMFSLESANLVECCTFKDVTFSDLGDFISFKIMQGYSLVKISTEPVD